MNENEQQTTGEEKRFNWSKFRVVGLVFDSIGGGVTAPKVAQVVSYDFSHSDTYKLEPLNLQVELLDDEQTALLSVFNRIGNRVQKEIKEGL